MRTRFNDSRRRWMQAASLGLLGAGAAPWWGTFTRAAEAAEEPGGGSAKRRCVLLWMAGGPSTIDLWDLKPGHANGGEFKETDTKVPGLKISEHLPKLAAQADRLAIIRSLSTREGDHGRGTYLMRTGHPPMGGVDYPSVGASLSKELGGPDDVPHNVSISPYRAFNQQAYGSGFLGPQHSPLTVGAADLLGAAAANAPGNGYAELKVDDLRTPTGVGETQHAIRLEMWRRMQTKFLARHGGAAAVAQNTVHERALKVMQGSIPKAFELDEESAATRDRYGRGRFGQGCLMARRLLERDVPFVEVSLGTFGGDQVGWDTHADNFAAVRRLCEELDAGWSSLMDELAERGLLESTTILWMGEFGRTPIINAMGGRDHYPQAWSCVFAGGGIRAGQAIGRTSADGMMVEDAKANEADVLATLCKAVGVDPATENITGEGRPIKLAEGTPIDAVLS